MLWLRRTWNLLTFRV